MAMLAAVFVEGTEDRKLAEEDLSKYARWRAKKERRERVPRQSPRKLDKDQPGNCDAQREGTRRKVYDVDSAKQMHARSKVVRLPGVKICRQSGPTWRAPNVDFSSERRLGRYRGCCRTVDVVNT